MPYPPHDFQYSYTDSCPHLKWLSTKWVLEAYQRADDTYDEHLRIVDNFYNELQAKRDQIRTLERENAELKAKLKLLHQRQFKPNKKNATPNSVKDDASISQEKKKRGAPVGHPG